MENPFSALEHFINVFSIYKISNGVILNSTDQNLDDDIFNQSRASFIHIQLIAEKTPNYDLCMKKVMLLLWLKPFLSFLFSDRD